MGHYDNFRNGRPIIKEINDTIEELKNAGKRVSNKAIGEKLGVSKQYIHKVLKESRCPTSFQLGVENKLAVIDTEKFTPQELKEQIGYSGAKQELQTLLNFYNFPYKKIRTDLMSALQSIETENFTPSELKEMTQYQGRPDSLRNFLNRHNFSYKKMVCGPKKR